MDSIQICQPCFEAALQFGLSEWIGVIVLAIMAAISFFSKKNFFSMAKGVYEFAMKIYHLFKKDENVLKG